MAFFPAASSILSSIHLNAFLQEKYAFSTDVSCKLIKAGINHTYLIKDGSDKFIFRIYSFNWRTEKEISEEIRLLTLLQTNRIPVSYAIADVNDNFIQTFEAIEGKRLAVLFSYANGGKMLSFSPEIHFKIGEIMANIHKQTLDLKLERVEYTPERLVEDSLVNLAGFLPEESEEMAFMKSTQQYLKQELLSVDLSEIRKGVVHLDIWFDNLNISSDNEVTIFDFDFCGNGWLCLDIAYYVLQIHSTEKDENECNLRKESFLRGYESVTAISGEEKRLLPMLGVALYLFYIGIQCERYENWSNTFLNEVYLKRYINLLIKKYFESNQ